MRACSLRSGADGALQDADGETALHKASARMRSRLKILGPNGVQALGVGSQIPLLSRTCHTVVGLGASFQISGGGERLHFDVYGLPKTDPRSICSWMPT